MIDKDAIEAHLIRLGNPLFEIRIIDDVRDSEGIIVDSKRYSRYFDDPALAARAIVDFDRLHKPTGVYATINEVDPTKRRPTRTFEKSKTGFQTSKEVIARRRHLFIDLDPKRPTKTGATQQQVDSALQLGDRIELFLLARGWPVPMRMTSGNGSYLIYRCDLPTESTVHRDLLHALIIEFSEDQKTLGVDIDNLTHDAPRISRVAGTINRKGDGRGEMPYRLVRCTSEGDQQVVTDEMLNLVALPTNASVKKQRRLSPQPLNGADCVDEGNASEETIASIRSLLRHVDAVRADRRDDWLRIGMGLHSVHHSLLKDWIKFSKKSIKYNEGECERFWLSFNRGGGVGAGTVAYYSFCDKHRQKMRIYAKNASEWDDSDEILNCMRIRNNEAGKQYRLEDSDLIEILQSYCPDWQHEASDETER